VTPSNCEEPVVVQVFENFAGPKTCGFLFDEPLDGFPWMKDVVEITFVPCGELDDNRWLSILVCHSAIEDSNRMKYCIGCKSNVRSRARRILSMQSTINTVARCTSLAE